nr:hypothetical protein [Tanacetum cinerariifolium]
MYLFKWSGKIIAMLPLGVTSLGKKFESKTLVTLVSSPKEFQAEGKKQEFHMLWLLRELKMALVMQFRKKCLTDESSVISLDDVKIDPKITTREESVAKLGRKSRQLRNKGIPLVEVQWKHRKGTSIRWEAEEKMRIIYPHLFQEYMLGTKSRLRGGSKKKDQALSSSRILEVKSRSTKCKVALDLLLAM